MHEKYANLAIATGIKLEEDLTIFQFNAEKKPVKLATRFKLLTLGKSIEEIANDIGEINPDYMLVLRASLHAFFNVLGNKLTSRYTEDEIDKMIADVLNTAGSDSSIWTSESVLEIFVTIRYKDNGAEMSFWVGLDDIDIPFDSDFSNPSATITAQAMLSNGCAIEDGHGYVVRIPIGLNTSDPIEVTHFLHFFKVVTSEVVGSFFGPNALLEKVNDVTDEIMVKVKEVIQSDSRYHKYIYPSSNIYGSDDIRPEYILMVEISATVIKQVTVGIKIESGLALFQRSEVEDVVDEKGQPRIAYSQIEFPQ